MRKEIIISEANDLAVVFENGRPAEFFLRSGDQLVGDIIWGQVEAVVPGIEAAFVNIGQERNGFIHVADLPSAQTPRKTMAPKRPTIRQKERILVQIAKAPTGNKGARLTGRITIPGRFLVLVPHDNRVSISRRIEATSERDRLRRLTLKLKDPGHGLIVRTEAIGRSEDDLRQDIEELIDIWADILHQVQIVHPPALLHRDSDLIHRVLRDATSSDVSKIVIDSQGGYQKAREILKGWMPELVRNVVQHRGSQSILDRYRIREELEAAISPKVWLPSGGYLVIEPTEALTVIDVNSGRLTQSRSLADTVLKTNMEAAVEVARQLRLRDIGGIVVIDFISMDHASDRNKVLAAFHEALREDKSRPQVTGFSEHGLIEVSRRRQGQNLMEQLTVPCEECHGSGRKSSSPLLSGEHVHAEAPVERAERGRGRGRRVAEDSELIHEISAEPIATEIVLPEANPSTRRGRSVGRNVEVASDEEEDVIIDLPGEDDEDSETEIEASTGRRRRRRRRRGRGRGENGEGAEHVAPLGHMLTSTSPEGLSPEDEDEEGFLPPVMVPQDADQLGRGRGRDRGRGGRDRNDRDRVASARVPEAVEEPLFEEFGIEEVSLGDMFAAPASADRGESRDRGGRSDRGGRDRGERGGRDRSDRGDRGGRFERGPRYDDAPRPEREARPVSAPVSAPAYEVSAPAARVRRVERKGEAVETPVAAPVARPERRPAREAAPAAVVAPVAAPAAVKPAPKAAPRVAAKAAPAPVAEVVAPVSYKIEETNAFKLDLPEELETTGVTGVFVLKKKPKGAAAAEAEAPAKKATSKAAPKKAATAVVEAEPEVKKPAARRTAAAKAPAEAAAKPAAKKAAPKAAVATEEAPAKAAPAKKAAAPKATPAAKKATTKKA